MFAIVLKASLLLLVSAASDRVLRRRASAGTRHLLWSLTIISLLLLPLLAELLPAWRVWVRDAAVARPATMPGDSPTNTSALPWQPLLVWGYFTVVAILLLAILREHIMVRRATQCCRPVRGGEWLELLRRTSAELGVVRNVRLLESDAAVMPLTWGTLRPAILLPSHADTWSHERRRAVLLHELAHVARHDCFTQLLASLACALYWLHPVVWFAAHRLRIEREIACDDVAVMRGVSAHDYARHLLEIAHRYRAPHLTVAVNMATHPVERRLHALIDSRRTRHAPRRAVTLAAVLGASLIVFPLAAAVSAQERPIRAADVNSANVKKDGWPPPPPAPLEPTAPPLAPPTAPALPPASPVESALPVTPAEPPPPREPPAKTLPPLAAPATLPAPPPLPTLRAPPPIN